MVLYSGLAMTISILRRNYSIIRKITRIEFPIPVIL